VEATNSQGSLLTLQLGDVSSGINVQNITGLDPVKATLVSSSFADQDGAVYQSSRRDTRNIVMTLEIDPDPTVMSVLALRRILYRQFRPKDQISLKFYVDDADDSIEDGYQISGVVESCESAMFSQTSVLTVSVICFDPDFYDPIPVTVTGLETTDSVATYFPYTGSVDTGITFVLNVNRSVSAFSLYYVDANLQTWTMDFAYALVAGDVVTISTVPGNKYASLVRAGVTSSVLYAISPQSVWPKFAPGDNWFRVYASGAAIPASVSYTKRYGEL
jgi:hypothetical protein